MTITAQNLSPMHGSPAGPMHAACVALVVGPEGGLTVYGPFESAAHAVTAKVPARVTDTVEVHTLYGSGMSLYLSHHIAFAWDLLDTSLGIEVLLADVARVVYVRSPEGGTTMHGPFRDEDTARGAAEAIQRAHPDADVVSLVLRDLNDQPLPGRDLVTVLNTLTEVSKVLRLAVTGLEGLGISEHGTVECTDCRLHTPFLDLTTHWCPETGTEHDYTEL